jgi:tetratricopeptide (TPR) repeat protein
LALALEEQAVRVQWMGADRTEQLERVRHLEARFGALWGGMGAVAEAFGVAYKEAGDGDAAITWYERALAATDGSATMKAQEQLHNLRARRGWHRCQRARIGSAAWQRWLSEVQDAAERLAVLAALQPSVERMSLVGSAHKRLALIHQQAGHEVAAGKALADAAGAYFEAEQIAASRQDPQLFYPALNRMTLEYVLSFGQRGWPGFDAAEVAAVVRSLHTSIATEPDFWAHAATIELDVLQALAGRRLAAERPALELRFATLADRVKSVRMWGSVADNAGLVLGVHAERTRGAEAAAAKALLAVLEGYAKG